MQNFYCTIHPDNESVSIFRDGRIIGNVGRYQPDDEPTIYLIKTYRLSFNEIEIIMDNWNEMIQMIQWMAT